VRQFVACLLGVLGYKALDLTGERLDVSGLSLAFLGFAVGIALLFTLVTDNDPIPSTLSPEKRTKILRRIAKQSLLMGFFWQTVLSKLQEMIEL
jgi:hypothetical protein